MVQIGNFSAWIQVDNSEVQEYGLEYSADGMQVSCWIPSEAGKAFAICVKDSLKAYSSSTTTYIDGTRCPGGKVIQAKSIRGRDRPHCTQSGIRISNRTYKPFFFSNCILMDDEDFHSAVPRIGEIKVVVHEVIVAGHGSRRYRNYELPTLHMSEKEKKGIVHGTQLGAEVLKKSRKSYNTIKVRSVATFIFKYRPLAALQANDIAPVLKHNIHQATASSSRDIIDLTMKDEEPPRRSRRIRQTSTQLSKTAGVKTEVKTEGTITLDPDIIDLTCME